MARSGMMRSAALCITFAFATVSALAAQTTADQGAQWSAGLYLGYRSGFGVQANGMVSGFTPSFPVMARFGIGYTSLDAGKPLEARRVFINDATNGVPEESGHTWSFDLDVLYPVKVLTLPRSYLSGGVRYARFTGDFKFVGGNEDFDIKSTHWGLGAGLETYFWVSPSVDLVLSTGLDYFFSSRLTGHDTSYSPDESNVNPRNDYTYADADAAVGQPKLEPLVMLGFSYRF